MFVIMPRYPRTPPASGSRKPYRYSPYIRPLVHHAARWAVGKAGRYIAGKAGSYVRRKARRLFSTSKTKTNEKSGSGKRKYQYYSQGTSVGRFRRPKKARKAPLASTHGQVLKWERGGTLSDPQCVYIGHCTTPFNRVVDLVAACIVRELYRQKGEVFTNWDNPSNAVPLQVRIQYSYYTDYATSTQTTVTLAIGGAATYLAIAEQVSNSLVANNTGEKMILRDFLLQTDGTPGAGNWELDASISMKQFYLYFDMYSKLSVQNRTLAGTTTVDDEDELAGDITNNPLVGRQYTGFGNGWIPAHRETGLANWNEGFVCDGTNGILNRRAQDVGTTQFNKPPSAYAFDIVPKTSIARIMPGQIKVSVLKYKKNMSINGWLAKYSEEINQANLSNVHTTFGNCVMFGLEKQLDSRATENPINIAYEVDKTFKVSYKYKPNVKTMAIVNVV